MLGWWLCERQLPSGGLNGEIERVIYEVDVHHLSSLLFLSALCK